jgi:hypothetical protein
MLRNALFIVKYAFRNVTRNFFRSLSLLVTIIMMSFIFLVTFTINDALNYSFRKNAEISYSNVDIEVTFDSNSKGHILRDEQLKAFSKYYDYYAGFFWVNTVIKTDMIESSVDVLAGTSEELNNFIGTNLGHLQYNEVIITKTLAEEIKAKVGQKVTLYVGDDLEHYIIKTIVDDEGIFSNKTALIQRDYLFKNHSESLVGLKLDNIEEIGIVNKVFINLKDTVDTITYYIDSIKFIIRELYINHPNYSYKFEAKYYLDKISVYASKVIEEYLDKIDECLSGEEIIMRLQTCYDKIVSNNNEEITTKEIHGYIDKAYIAIEKEREYITKPWRKIETLMTKLYIELDFSDDDFIYEEEDSDLIGGYLKIIYETIFNCYNKRDKPDVIIPSIEENQKKIMNVISKYAFLCYYEEPDDSYERWYDTFPDFNKKYLSPIKKIIKECVDLESFL